MKTLLAILLALIASCPAYAIERNVSGQKVTVVAIDSATNRPKTGDSANITLYYSKDDGTVTAISAASVSEDSSTNAPGSYSETVTNTECDATKLKISGKSSTTGIDIVPVTLYTMPAGFSTLTIASNAVNADAKKINAVSTSSVTTINANLGTTQPVNFTGTSTSALVKGDTVDFGGAAGTFASGIPAVNTTQVSGVAQTARDMAGALPPFPYGTAGGIERYRF